MRGVSALLLAVLLATSLPGMAVASGGGLGTDAPAAFDGATAATVGGAEIGDSGSVASLGHTTTATSDENVIHKEFALRQLPDRPGEFETELTVSVPESVVELEVTLHGEARVDATDGFERSGDRTYEWTESTTNPSVTYRLPANRTGVESDLAAGVDHEGSGFTFVETGSWGIVEVPRVSMRWKETRSTSTGRSVAVDGPGAAGDVMAFFGPVEEYTNAADGETHRLVVPDAADLEESPQDVLDALAAANERLPIGAGNDELFAIVAPTDGVDWGPSGLQVGDADMWVRDDARLDEARNVWFHEYVHTRQPFAGVGDGTTSETEWLVEGQADYYAGLLALETGRVSYDEFRSLLERGQSSAFTRGVMVDPDSWDDERTDYARGPLVLGAIDREIRVATDGERTLANVFRDVNRGDLPVTQAAFLETVERYGGADARAAAVRYTETETIPDTWSRSDHRAAFEVETASFAAGLGDGEIRVTGDYRDAAYDDVPAIVPRETVAFPVAVENVGDRAGAYDATLTVEGSIVDLRSGHLDVGGSVVETVRWTPEAPGTYDVRVGDEAIAVTVSAPAEAVVTDLSVDPRTVDPGESVTVTATVAADDDLPSTADLEVRTPAGVEDEHTVRLGPGETTTVQSTLTFHEEARHEVTVGGQSTTVGVGTAAAMQERVAAAGERVPGFGVAYAVVALLAAAALVARRR